METIMVEMAALLTLDCALSKNLDEQVTLEEGPLRRNIHQNQMATIKVEMAALSTLDCALTKNLDEQVTTAI